MQLPNRKQIPGVDPTQEMRLQQSLWASHQIHGMLRRWPASCSRLCISSDAQDTATGSIKSLQMCCLMYSAWPVPFKEWDVPEMRLQMSLVNCLEIVGIDMHGTMLLWIIHGDFKTIRIYSSGAHSGATFWLSLRARGRLYTK